MLADKFCGLDLGGARHRATDKGSELCVVLMAVRKLAYVSLPLIGVLLPLRRRPLIHANSSQDCFKVLK